jgi:hypothetical protein
MYVLFHSLFGGGLREDFELCIIFRCRPQYGKFKGTETVGIQISKAELIVNLDFWGGKNIE